MVKYTHVEVFLKETMKKVSPLCKLWNTSVKCIINTSNILLTFMLTALCKQKILQMRRKDGGLSIQQQWHLIYENKKALKRSKFKLNSNNILPFPPFLKNSSLPSLVHFKPNKRQSDQKDSSIHRNSDDRRHKIRYSQSSLEVTKLKNEYCRNKLNNQSLDFQKKLGYAMRTFIEENKRWVLQSKFKMI